MLRIQENKATKRLRRAACFFKSPTEHGIRSLANGYQWRPPFKLFRLQGRSSQPHFNKRFVVGVIFISPRSHARPDPAIEKPLQKQKIRSPIALSPNLQDLLRRHPPVEPHAICGAGLESSCAGKNMGDLEKNHQMVRGNLCEF